MKKIKKIDTEAVLKKRLERLAKKEQGRPKEPKATIENSVALKPVGKLGKPAKALGPKKIKRLPRI